MLAKTESIEADAQDWLARFERALAGRRCALAALFHADSYWRDVLALTWHIRTVHGADAIARELKAHAGAAPTGFRLDPQRTAPRQVTRVGTDAIEAIFSFETAQGRGSGVVRLTPGADDGAPQGLDAAHRARRDQGPRGARRPGAADRAVLRARFPRAELARPAQGVRRLCRPRSGRAGGRRRAGRAVDRRAPDPTAGRHADRRSRAAHRRQLAQALSRADPAQPGAGQSPALHAVPAELADLHSEGQGRRLVRGLCGEPGAQLLAGDRARERQLRRGGRAAGRSCCAAPTARRARCIRATS